MQHARQLFFILLFTFFAALPIYAASVDISVGSSNGPITVAVNEVVTFDAYVICDDDLVYVEGTAVPKDTDNDSEAAWRIQNQSIASIRITGFGVGWECINDPSGQCDTWLFDYLKFDSPVINANKIYDLLISPVDNANSFPVTDFDTLVGDVPYDNMWIDISPDEVIAINEIEFVDSHGNKITMASGTSVSFTVTWRDSNANTYVNIFTVTWP
jgi:hypothetical protein